jgi:dipeptidyl aminopeptidase/acylaminoacyl peptidase
MHPRVAPDSQSVYFLSARSGSMQVWRIALDGGEAQQVTRFPIGVNSFRLAPNGRVLLFSAEVYPECRADLECTKKRLDAAQADPSTGQLYDRIFVRHWDTWKDGTRSHLFAVDLDAQGRASEQVRWLSSGIDGDVPSKPFGDDSEYAVAPDSTSVVFAARVAGRTEPWSTNFDLYQVALAEPGSPKNLTANNPAWDTTPVFARDGKTLYYRAMTRPGFEADRFRIIERNLSTGAEREVAPNWDRSPDNLALSVDGKTLYAYADALGQRPLFAIDVAKGEAIELSGPGSVSGFAVGRNQVYFLRDDLDSPADVYRVGERGGEPVQLTRFNAERLSERRFGAYEQFRFSGSDGATVYGWVVKPANFQAGQKYPVAFIVHGGPQSSMGNSFHYRWNPQTYAGKGYAVVFIDFHGSTGYGQAFTDSISGDWGGRPLHDLKLGLEAAAQQYDFVDPSRACALGASYGGFMINWIAGNWSDGFKCLVNHAGIFDTRAMYYTTEELWFTEWEFGGPAFNNPAGYEKFNPALYVQNWSTPMLVTHGALDFRVPYGQGIATFTTLQRMGIDSQFLFFPDENHWILKPHNSVQWHRTVEAWLAKHLEGEAPKKRRKKKS